MLPACQWRGVVPGRRRYYHSGGEPRVMQRRSACGMPPNAAMPQQKKAQIVARTRTRAAFAASRGCALRLQAKRAHVRRVCHGGTRRGAQ